MKNLLFTILVMVNILACGQKDDNALVDCGYCPNNTSCVEGDCGCPDENTFDMGSWCLKKQENLFVAEMLGCPCFETFGLVLLDMEPLDPNGGGVIISGSSFTITSRETYNSGFQSNGLIVYDRPDGDSIVMYGMPLPKQGYPLFCQVETDKRCWASLYGKFQGPDTIRATIRWENCSDNDGNFTTFDEEYPVLLTRWE